MYSRFKNLAFLFFLFQLVFLENLQIKGQLKTDNRLNFGNFMAAIVNRRTYWKFVLTTGRKRFPFTACSNQCGDRNSVLA